MRCRDDLQHARNQDQDSPIRQKHSSGSYRVAQRERLEDSQRGPVVTPQAVRGLDEKRQPHGAALQYDLVECEKSQCFSLARPRLPLLKTYEDNVHRMRNRLARRVPANAQRNSSPDSRASNIRRPLDATPSALVPFFRIRSCHVDGSRPQASGTETKVGSREDGIPEIAVGVEVPHCSLIDRIAGDTEQEREARPDHVQCCAGGHGGEGEDAIEYAV